jgi:hypothetical protein
MSEQILERSAAAPAGAGPDLGELGEGPAKGRNRTFLIVALAVIAGLVVGGLALFMLQPGSGDDLAADPVPGGVAAGAAAASTTGGEAGTEAGAGAESGAGAEAEVVAAPKKATARLTSRDPFAPLIPKKPAPKPKPVPAPVAPAAPVGAVPGIDVPAPSTPATGGTISALSVSPLGNAVTLKLDGKKYEVDEGETFAKSYRLYDIFNSNCAGFLYGDRNAVVCEGDSVTIG